MSCCNGRRSAAARHGVLRAAAIAQARPIGAVPDGDTVALLYRGPDGVAFRGPVSGAVYPPGRNGRRIAVDRRDVAIFLRSSLFGPAE